MPSHREDLIEDVDVGVVEEPEVPVQYFTTPWKDTLSLVKLAAKWFTC